MKFHRKFALALLCTLAFWGCAKSDEQSKADRQYVTASGGLNMRNAPSAAAPVVVLIPENAEVTVLERIGDEVEISGRRGKWTRVRSGAHQGWVFGGFLSENPPAEKAKPEGCVSSLAGFTSGCIGSSCTSGSACGDKLVFRSGGVFAEVYCDGGSLGKWRIEGETLIAETETNMAEGHECFGGAENREEECKAEAARKYAGIVTKSTRVFTLKPDGTVYEVTTIERTGQAPVVSQGPRTTCLLNSIL